MGYTFYKTEVAWNLRRNGRDSLGFRWISPLGFGELSFSREANAENWDCDFECMSRQFVIAALRHFLSTAPAVRKAKNRRWNKRRMDPRVLAKYLMYRVENGSISDGGGLIC